MCSYCGCDSITVIGRFMDEHVDIVNALGRLTHAIGELDGVRARADELAALLGAHTGAEEAGLFSVMRRRDEFAAHIGTLCGEHRSLDELLAAIADGDHALLPAFERALRDHIDKEDNGLFPAAASGLDGDEWREVDERTHEHEHAHGIPHTH